MFWLLVALLLALNEAYRELGVARLVKLRAERFKIVERTLDRLWEGDGR